MQGDKPVIRYAIGDRVVVCIDGEHRKGKVVRITIDEAWRYFVRLDGERDLIPVHETAIVKQADSGGMGPVKHLGEI